MSWWEWLIVVLVVLVAVVAGVAGIQAKRRAGSVVVSGRGRRGLRR